MINRYKNVSIIYGGNGKKYAEKLNQRIIEVAETKRYPISATLIMDDVLTGELLTDVMSLFRDSEYCVAFLTADDCCEIGKTPKKRLRQNVVFEIGMALIQMGSDRCILLSDFDYSAEDFELPSDMNSLEILKFEPQDLNTIIDKVIDKILRTSSISIKTGIIEEDVPRYDNLFFRADYYLDYENVFKTSGRSYEGADFYKNILSDWLYECKSLKYYDEKCMYLFERIGLLPIFGKNEEVKQFLQQAASFVEAYKKIDIRYYKDVEVLNFIKNLIASVIEYTQIKASNGSEEQRRYEEILEILISEKPAAFELLNPIIKLVYFDYLGLVYLRLYRLSGDSIFLNDSQKAFHNTIPQLKHVDMHLQIWGGFVFYNLARTYALQDEVGEAESFYKKAIKIRENWIKSGIFNATVRNALSYEYFLAKVYYTDMCSDYGLKTEAELLKDYESIEAELNAYSDFSLKVNQLNEIRKMLQKRRTQDSPKK